MNELYQARLNGKGDGVRDRKIQNMKEGIARDFVLDPSFYILTAQEPDAAETTTKRIQIHTASFLSGTDPSKATYRSFTLHPEETIEQGTILFDFDSQDWLVLLKGSISEVHQKGVIQRINYVVKWMDGNQIKENSVIVSNYSRGFNGVDDNFYIQLPENRLEFILPKNETTKTLKRNTRLMVNGTPYEILKVDDYANTGLIILSLTEDQIGPNDNIELGICDYVVEEDESAELFISGSDLVTYGMDYEYSVKNMGTDETVDTWEITQGEEFLSSVDLTGPCTIRIKDSKDLVGETIRITATTSLANVIVKTITIRSLL